MNATIDLVLGAVFVVFYAAGRFNTPATNRSSTTAGRYFLALFFYCLVGVILYAVLVHFPHLLAFLMQGDDSAVEPWARKLSSPLLVALLLTVLLPKLPLLSELDRWVRQQLQDMAAIPYEVRRLSAELRKGKLEANEALQETVREKLEGRGFGPKDIIFEPGHTPAHQWTRLAVMLASLEDWESDRKMAGYLATVPGEIDQFRKRQEQLLPKAKMCFRLMHESADGFTSRTHEAVVRYQEDFTEQLLQLHSAVLEFISRGVLHSELTDGARLSRLRSLGFEVEWRRATFTFNQIMTLFGMLFLVMLTGMVVFSNGAGRVTFGLMLVRLVMVSLIYCVAVTCAVLPKEKWKFARHRPGEVRPIGFYIASGLMAVVLSQIISLFFNCLVARSVLAGAQRFLVTYPWLLSTFATAVMTGFMIDNPRFPRISRTQQRLLEGLGQGLVMVGVAYLTRIWLCERVEQVVTLPVNYRVPGLEKMMVMAGVIGFVLGFCIPTWCREAPRSRAEVKQPDDALDLLPRGQSMVS